MIKNKIKISNLLSAAVLFVTAAFPVYGTTGFSSLDLNNDDYLLFTVSQSIPGSPDCKSLFYTRLTSSGTESAPQILTCFPEKMELLDGGRILQLRNRYGKANYYPQTQTLSWIQESCGDSIPVDYTHIGPQSVSPDGKYLCYVNKTGNAVGQLILESVETGVRLVLDDDCAFSYDELNVKWSPDSTTLLYDSNESIYFITPSSAMRNVQLPENYRKIGRGSINSVQWTNDGKIIYIDKDIVYSILENELYTRGLYSEMVGSGTIIGRLPTEYSPLHDRFWCNSDGTRLVVVSSDKILGVYHISDTTASWVDCDGFYPLTGIKGAPLSYSVFWKNSQTPIIWIDMLNYESGRKTSTVFDLEDGMVPLVDIKGSLSPVISPDGRWVAFTGGSSIYVYDINTWTLMDRLSGEKVHSFQWASANSMYVGGSETLRYWEFDPTGVEAGRTKVLYISSAENSYWDGGRIVVRINRGSNNYVYDASRNGWTELSYETVPEISHNEKNNRFRVFIAGCRNRNFDNGIYVRSLSGNVITYPVYPDVDTVIAPSRKVSLVYDAMDNAEGLGFILHTLDEFGYKATFFINGEFIRRYPTEVKQIIAAGHECASSFYSSADLTSPSFVIDSNFIKRGLARNEDEFFTATGSELSLLWHAPYYRETEMMKAAGSSAGYTYVDAFTDVSDLSTYENEGDGYMDSSRLIDALVSSLEPGMIIPVSASKPEGTRKDYLYENLDLLISAILDAGWEIVPVQELLNQE